MQRYGLPLCFLLGIMVLNSCRDKSYTSENVTLGVPVMAARVSRLTIQEFLTFNGITKYQRSENIRSNVTGYISDLPFRVGDTLYNGQVFTQVRTKEQDALREASRIDSTLKSFIKPIRLRSNSTGVLTAINVNSNDYVAEGDLLATVKPLNSLVIQVNVPFEYENAISVGTECIVLLQNKARIKARINSMLPTVDPPAQSKTYLIHLPNDGLPEGLNVRVQTLFREADSVPTLPKSAIQTNELRTAFWVMHIVDDTLAVRLPVVLGLQNDSLVQLVDGALQVGDMVITEGGYQLQDSSTVKIVQ